jgi:hypothetical protein
MRSKILLGEPIYRMISIRAALLAPLIISVQDYVWANSTVAAKINAAGRVIRAVAPCLLSTGAAAQVSRKNKKR